MKLRLPVWARECAASLRDGPFRQYDCTREVDDGRPVSHVRQRLDVWPIGPRKARLNCLSSCRQR